MRLRRVRRVGGVGTVAVLIVAVAAVIFGTPASGAPAPWPSIGAGQQGADVTAIQYLLRQHGSGIDADGHFGPLTEAAVVDFQSSRGLVADGVVGPQTWPRLIVEVREGSRGEAVKAAQTQLNKHGAGLAVDGQFGPLTRSAVISFQSSRGLIVDGIVGPQTWQALVAGGGGGPSGYSLPLARDAVPRSAYAQPHWNSTPAVDLIVSYLPTYAVTSGVVDHYSSDSCGIGIRLLQPDGSRFVYCHLSARSVGEGAQVSAGTRLGTTGDTGNSGAPHLHIEIRTGGDGLPRCPQSYLLAIYDGVQPPSLNSLPTWGCTGG